MSERGEGQEREESGEAGERREKRGTRARGNRDLLLQRENNAQWKKKKEARGFCAAMQMQR